MFYKGFLLQGSFLLPFALSRHKMALEFQVNAHPTPYTAKESLTKPENDHELGTPEKPKRRAPRIPHEYEDDPAKLSEKERRIKGASLASHKPSYCLKRVRGSSECEGKSLRSQHRKKLRWLVKKLIKSRNWTEAGGVLSVLLQGSGRDQSPSLNRAKYWVFLSSDGLDIVLVCTISIMRFYFFLILCISELLVWGFRVCKFC